MGQIGIWMVILGGGSMLLNLIGMEFLLLSWVDMWGPLVGWAIRIGFMAVGAGLIVMGQMRGKESE